MNHSGARRQDGETDCQLQGDLDLESVFKASESWRYMYLAEMMTHFVSLFTNLTTSKRGKGSSRAHWLHCELTEDFVKLTQLYHFKYNYSAFGKSLCT
jgi:hypothetical protein